MTFRQTMLMLPSLYPSKLYNALREPRFASLDCPEMVEVTDLQRLGADNELKQSTARGQVLIYRLIATTAMNRTLGQALRISKLKMSSRVLVARWSKYAPSTTIP
jgi:hypothetical protein